MTKIKTPKYFKWKVEVEIKVDPMWVADGYYPNPERIEEGLRLSHASAPEMPIRAKVMSGPTQKEIDTWLKNTPDF